MKKLIIPLLFLFILCTWVTLKMEPLRYMARQIVRPTNILNDPSSLRFDGNNSFTIVQFADLHFRDPADSDFKSTQVMLDIIQFEPKIDFAVFSGDQVYGFACEYVRDIFISWIKTLTPVANHKIPFATIFGNHDDQPNNFGPVVWYEYVKLSLIVLVLVCIIISNMISGMKSRQFKILSLAILCAGIWILFQVRPSTLVRISIVSYENYWFPTLSKTQRGPSFLHGVSNFYLPVFNENKTVLMFFLDSGGGRIPELLLQTQIDWVKTISSQYNSPDSILFFHIPSKEFSYVDKFKCIGKEESDPPSRFEGDTGSPMNDLGLAGIRAVFAGHDHGNSWCCIPKTGTNLLKMPTLCYGRHTGYGGYGRQKRGARIIQLESNERTFKIKSWLRMEDGSLEMQGYIYD
jgi:hypothetical protein